MTESKIQQDIVVWFRNNYCLKHHNPRYCIFSVPNEMHNHRQNERVIEAKNKRNTGMLTGVSDLIVLLPNQSLFIEVKTPTGVQSNTQKDFQDTVQKLGFKYYLIRTLEEFKQCIKEHH